MRVVVHSLLLRLHVCIVLLVLLLVGVVASLWRLSMVTSRWTLSASIVLLVLLVVVVLRGTLRRRIAFTL